MLERIEVTNFSIIKKAVITFAPGFNVITGETGSGKTLVIKSLLFLFGQKPQALGLEKTENAVKVSGIFNIGQRPDIQNFLNVKHLITPDSADTLIIARVWHGEKNRYFVNEQSVTHNLIKNLLHPLLDLTVHAPLLEFTQQSDAYNLFDPDYQRAMLDAMANLTQDVMDFRKDFQDFKQLEKKLNELKVSQKEKQKRIDFLIYQINEIENFEPSDEDANIDIQIETVKQNIKNLSQIKNSLDLLSEQSGSILSNIHLLKRMLPQDHPDWIQSCEQAISILEDLSFQLSRHLTQNDLDILTQELERLENRYFQLKNLLKKYGPTITDLKTQFESLKKELENLQKIDQILEQLEAEITKKIEFLKNKAQRLTTIRNESAKKINAALKRELEQLNMRGFESQYSILTSPNLHEFGQDLVMIQCRSSPQQPWKPLEGTISGGELSRLLLAIKSLLPFENFPRTSVFDEIDTGVSGQTAAVVGQKLKNLSKKTGQVICVTHLPQVAAYADHHILVEKKPRLNQDPEITIQSLDLQDRFKELARLISGAELTNLAILQAEELWRQAHGHLENNSRKPSKNFKSEKPQN